MMGGSIAVESEYGNGSVFTAEIIQGIVESSCIGQKIAEDLRSFSYKPARENQIQIIRTWMPRATALVVDDIGANRKVAKGLLGAYGMEVHTAASGQEAIELAKQHDYDVVFMDHMMPEMNGIEAAAAIKRLGAAAPIVAVTASAMQGMKNFFLGQGFDDYL
jgi:CheY-like chemotaxis protein